ncbi:MAG: prenyltransferase/squalene oxidase repeat-containing protein [Planctomycetota bacterium]|jgi:hypothetical protein
MDAIPKELVTSIETINSCSLPEGGFAAKETCSFRPDATAWAVIALRTFGQKNDIIQKAQKQLAILQSPDGRVAMSKNQPKVLWPTPLAILAWLNVPEFKQPKQQAIDFLFSVSGTQVIDSKGIFKHNATLKGWPWNENTHSWVIPTAMSLMALKACGYNEHERVLEAVKLLVDRQLPSGGWNYGNTIVFEQELLPIPECTGYALNALAGYIEYRQVEKSIEYLKKHASNLKSPLSLSWAILGLGAWSSQPANAKQLLLQCLAAQSRYGSYSTDLLSQILISYRANSGLLSIFENMES